MQCWFRQLNLRPALLRVRSVGMLRRSVPCRDCKGERCCYYLRRPASHVHGRRLPNKTIGGWGGSVRSLHSCPHFVLCVILARARARFKAGSRRARVSVRFQNGCNWTALHRLALKGWHTWARLTTGTSAARLEGVTHGSIQSLPYPPLGVGDRTSGSEHYCPARSPSGAPGISPRAPVTRT